MTTETLNDAFEAGYRSSSAPRHAEHKAKGPKWQYAWDVYTGEYVDEKKLGTYLIQRKQGEHDEAYKERKRLADPALDLAAVVDSLTGLLFAADEKTSRTWTLEPPSADGGAEGAETRGLGDPEQRGTIAYRLSRDLDGAGTNLDTALKRAATRFGVQHRVWCLVDGEVAEGEGSDRRVLKASTAHLIDPRDVVTWKERYGRLVDVLVRDHEDRRADALDTEAEGKDFFVRYTEEGWQRYEETEAGLEPIGEVEDYEYWKTADRRVPILPIFYVDLPLPRMSGYLLAKKCVALFNAESELDNLFRLGCTPRFGVDTGEMGVVDFESVREDIGKGHAIIEGAGHQYISPPADIATARMDRLKQKRTDFYSVAFREYGDAAAEATATERRQDWAAGVVAYLTLLAGAVEELEVQMMWRMEQVEFPEQPQLWGLYAVDRSKEFQPEDVREALAQLKEQVFGMDTIPVPEAVATEVAKRLLERHGVAVEEEELQQSVRAWMDRRDQAGAMGPFGGPNNLFS